MSFAHRVVVLVGLAAAAPLEPLHADDECTSEGCGLNALQLRAARDSEDLNLTRGTPGTVYAMYTYGAVATSKKPLQDLSQASRSFRGLRCYTETVLAASRLTDIAAIFKTSLYHPQVPTLALHWEKDSEFYPGAGRPDLPKHEQGRSGEISHHFMNNYIERLAHVQLHGQDVTTQAPFSTGLELAFMSWGAYEKQTSWATGEEVSMEKIRAKHLQNWRLVAHTQQDTLEAVDNIWLLQHEGSLDCALAFQGTHTFAEFFANLKNAPYGYCGFDGVQSGYADKLYWLMKYSMPKLRPALAKCNKVMCTGHSLGGSLCEVFAACANSNRAGNKHYEMQAFSKEAPELMPIVKQLNYSRSA